MIGNVLRERYFRGSLIPTITQVLWLGSLLCIFFAFVLIFHELQHLADRKSTNGEVIGYVESEHTNRFHPKIRFSDVLGKSHEFIDATGATAPLYLVGTIVQVDYHPNNPKIAEMTTLYYRWGGTFGLLFISAICWILGSRFTYRVQS